MKKKAFFGGKEKNVVGVELMFGVEYGSHGQYANHLVKLLNR